MKMGDGGFRPAFNVQFAVDTESRAVVGVDVSDAGTDRGWPRRCASRWRGGRARRWRSTCTTAGS